MTYTEISNKLKKLLAVDESSAKEYFYNVMNDPATYQDLSNKEIHDLMLNKGFKDHRIEYMMKIMCSDCFYDCVDYDVERRIFIDLLISKDFHELVIGDYFTELLKRHSEKEYFMTEEYVAVISNLSKYLSDDAIYYVLKSVDIDIIDRDLFKQVLNKLPLYPEDMDEVVLGLIESESFVHATSFKELKQLIERVTFNIKSSKELKSFLTKVIKTKAFKDKYIKNNKLINFQYKKKGIIYNINDDLMSNDFYKEYLDSNYSKTFYDLVNKFSDIDPMFLNYFNANSINQYSVLLDEGLLFGLIKSDYQDKFIQLIHSPSAFLFIRCANYLNNTYPNFNVGKLINNLIDFPLSEDFIKSCDNASNDLVCHYLINNIDWQLKDINQYEYKIMLDFTHAFKSDCDMKDFKNALTMNRYGFSYDQLKDIYYGYKQGINDFNDTNLIREFNEFKDIIFSNDKNHLNSTYISNIFSFEKSLTYTQHLKELYNKELINSVIDPNKLNYNSHIDYQGNRINIIKIDKPFKALISSVGFARKLDIINDNYKDSFTYHENYKNHSISMSYYTSSNLHRAGGEFVLGYSNLNDNSIQVMSPVDIFSDSDTYTLHCGHKEKYISYKDFANYTRSGFNELVVERKNLNPDDENYLKDIYPSYVLVDNLNYHLETAIKVSKDLDIPIVYIDTQKMLQDNKDRLNKAIKEFKGKHTSEFINVFNMIFDAQNYMTNKTFDTEDLQVIVDKFLDNPHTMSEYKIIEDTFLKEINKGCNDDYSKVYLELIKIRKHMNVDYSSIKLDINDESDLIKQRVDEFVDKGYLSKGYNRLPYKRILSMANIAYYLAKKTNYPDLLSSVDASMYVASNICDFIYTDYLANGNYFLMSRMKNKLELFDYNVEKKLNLIYLENLESSYTDKEDPKELSSIIHATIDIIKGNDLDIISQEFNIDKKELLHLHDKCNHLYLNEIKKVARSRK